MNLLTARKQIRGAKLFNNVNLGTYEVAYRKDGGTWIVIDELQVSIPTGRKAWIQIEISGEESDA